MNILFITNNGSGREVPFAGDGVDWEEGIVSRAVALKVCSAEPWGSASYLKGLRELYI